MSLEIEEVKTEPRAEKVTVVHHHLMILSLHCSREPQLTGLLAGSLTREPALALSSSE